MYILYLLFCINTFSSIQAIFINLLLTLILHIWSGEEDQATIPSVLFRRFTALYIGHRFHRKSKYLCKYFSYSFKDRIGDIILNVCNTNKYTHLAPIHTYRYLYPEINNYYDYFKKVYILFKTESFHHPFLSLPV